MPVVPLKLGAEMPLPRGMVLYYMRACYACGPALDLWRAYVDSAGRLQVVPITSPLVSVAADRTVTRIDAIATSPTEWLGTLCTGYCGGESPATPGSTKVAVFSRDGGITWERGNPVHVESFPVGRYRDDWLLRRWEGGEIHHSLYASGEAIEPPAGMERALATVSPDGRLTWAEQTDKPNPPRYYQDGSQVLPPFDTPTAYSFVGPNDMVRLVTVAVDGSADNVMSWFEGAWSGPIQLVEPGLLMGYGEIPYALYPAGTAPPAHELSPNNDVRAVFITVADATVHAIAGLPRGPEPGVRENRDFSYPRWFEFTGPQRLPPLRVATGGDCLNVRAAPTADAEVLRCYVDGVLLFERDAAAPDGWVAVTTPDGREGWAATEFLER